MQIRKLEKKDAPLMLEWMHDENINYWFRFEGSEKTLADIENYIKEANLKQNELHFAVSDDNDEYLGTVSLKNIDNESRQAEYAICLRSKAIGTNAAKFATDSILSIAFNELELNRIYLDVLAENIRADKFYIKYGWKFEGEFRQSILHKGRLKNLKWYSLLKGDL